MPGSSPTSFSRRSTRAGWILPPANAAGFSIAERSSSGRILPTTCWRREMASSSAGSSAQFREEVVPERENHDHWTVRVARSLKQVGEQEAAILVPWRIA